MIWLEFLVVLACIFIGARLGGISLGMVTAISSVAIGYFIAQAVF